MPLLRYRVLTLLLLTAVAAAILAFWRLKPRNDFLAVVPFGLLVIVLAIVLVTGAVMLSGIFRR